MFKNIIFTSILFYFICKLSVVFAVEPNNKNNTDKSKIKKNISVSNWVHPELRESYKGYTKFKEQKEHSPMWQYSTNRQSGNIKGGGAIKYNDYRPFYHPSMKIKKKN